MTSRRWRLCDADWNHWPDRLGDAAVWAAAAAAGFDGIELGVYVAAQELAPSRLASVQELARGCGVPVAMLLLSLPASRWPRGALSGPADVVGAVVAEAVATGRVAAGLGQRTIGLWPGADPAGSDVTAGAAAVVAALAPLGVRVAVEYKPDTAVATAADAQALCAAVPGLGVLLDTGHAYAAGEDPAEVVRRLGPLLWHLHLGDAAPGAADDDLPVGRLHDFGPFLTALAEHGYAGAATLDLYGAVGSGALTGVAAGRESRAHLLADRAG